MSAVERERELRRAFDQLRFAAPNPREFRCWDDFYLAQVEHEGKLGELEQQIEQAVQEAFATTTTEVEG